jgi:hypothetical protein
MKYNLVFENVEKIENAKVPLIRFRDRESQI